MKPANIKNLSSDADLGPFQAIWDAWNESHHEIACKPLSHFRRAMDIQFDEIEAHLAKSNRAAASYEVIDLVSIALNVMRWLSQEPKSIGELARIRAETRMKGQTMAILEKYHREYGISEGTAPGRAGQCRSLMPR